MLIHELPLICKWHGIGDDFANAPDKCSTLKMSLTSGDNLPGHVARVKWAHLVANAGEADSRGGASHLRLYGEKNTLLPDIINRRRVEMTKLRQGIAFSYYIPVVY